ncbi:MAG: methionyl-tRNA formyltransferase [Candidatus Nomurabacteria bacterium]|nr:methionyl-tRNA formyltransferase [Candidatus Nomurabacteria bacterium]
MQNENKKFIFFGTPDVAKKTLDILKENGYTPCCIVTSPDAPSGRGMIQTASPVSVWAEKNFIDCIKPTIIDDEFINTTSEYNADLFIVVAYGKILPEKLIKLPKLETINIHYSLLPKYRGASPVEQALLNGDKVTGVSIQQMVYKMDAGDIITELEIPIDITNTKSTLREKLINKGGELLVSTLPDIFNKKITLKKQDEKLATRCKKIKKEDGLINIDGDDWENYNKYRAYENWPSVFFMKDNKRIKITKAVFSDEKFVIIKVIPEGKKEIDYNIFNK